jgi:hypothetical protein
MSLQTLGYIGLRTKSLEDWTAYASRFLGMQLVDKSRGTASFRMDDKKQRLVVQESDADASGFFGWEVADAEALDAYATNLEKHKVSFARGSRAATRSATAWKSFTAPRPQLSRSSPAAPSPASAPARSAWAMPCSTASESTTSCRSTATSWASS